MYCISQVYYIFFYYIVLHSVTIVKTFPYLLSYNVKLLCQVKVK